MKKVNFALIGCGFIGKTHANVINSLPNAVLKVCCDTNLEMCKKFSEEYSCEYNIDYKQILDDENIDAVVICLPTFLHSEITIEAAQKGKHVLCEKPIELNIDVAQKMVDVANENNVKFSVIMQHRFDDPILAIKKAMSENVLGKILWGASRTIWYRNDQYFSNKWRGTWKMDGGGALMNQSIHYIDLLISIFGKVKSASGKCRTTLHDIESEDVGIANLEFENGTIGSVEGTTVAYPGHYTELIVFAENGTVFVRNDVLASYTLKCGTYQPFEDILNFEKANCRNEIPDVDETGHRRQYQDFIESILTDKPLAVSGQDALDSLKAIKAIYKSSRLKEEIYL